MSLSQMPAVPPGGNAHEVTDTGSPDLFRLHAPQQRLSAAGLRTRLTPGPANTLGERVSAFFAGHHDGPALLVGALPFDPRREDALYQPQSVSVAESGMPASQPGRAVAAIEHPPADEYAASVARCVAMLRAAPGDNDALHKVVLARSLRVEADMAVDPHALAARLGAGDAGVTVYVVPLPVPAGEAPAWLVGATPELLVSRRGREVVSHPLAGSARRSVDPVEDRCRSEALLASHKDLHEHRLVVEAILDGLAPLCSRLDAPPRPSLHATASMWHLATRIRGSLRDADVSSAALAGLLHPTPAVCGTPRLPALQAIRELEPAFDRGFYAGAVGWCDGRGDGDWHVAIRCAHVQGRSVRLFAGAGIVPGSEPALEVDETAGKFGALLAALGLDDVRTS